MASKRKYAAHLDRYDLHEFDTIAERIAYILSQISLQWFVRNGRKARFLQSCAYIGKIIDDKAGVRFPGWGEIRLYAKVHSDTTVFEPASSAGSKV